MKLLRMTLLCALALGGSTPAWAQPPGGGPFGQYPQAKPALGEAAPDFVLKDLEGRDVRLKDLLGKRPVVLEFGSYT